MSETLTLGDTRYVVTALPARRALHFAITLLRLAAPALAGGLGADVGAAVGAVLASPDLDGKLIGLLDEMAARTQVLTTGANGQVATRPLAPMLDEHFAGRGGDLLTWYLFAGRVNFSGFFADMPGMLRAAGLGNLQALIQSQSPTPAPGSG